MKRSILLVLTMSIVLVCAGCGKTTSPEKETAVASAEKESEVSVSEDPASAEKESEANASENSASAEKEPEVSASEDPASEDNKEEESAIGPADQAMVELANTNRQSYRAQLAFDEDHIYFKSNHDLYRCRYDGSDVQKLEMELDDIVVAEGKLWGYKSGDVTKPGALYSMDLSTGTMTQVLESSGGIASILVKGNRLCYVGENGTALIVRNLDNGEEKVISNYTLFKSGGLYDIAMCIYGDTLYALINNSGIYALCTYELDSDADTMNVLVEDLKIQRDDEDGFVPVWTNDGLLLLSYNMGEGQYIYAKYTDLEQEGKVDYYEEENKIGTKDTSYILNNINLPRFVLGNDLLTITDRAAVYYEGFDYSNAQTLWEGNNSDRAYELRLGMHEGSVYCYLEETSEILKISEGARVDHISVTIPES